MRGAVNIESLERSVLLLEWMKSLEVLKQSANADITEIKYVSRLLRDYETTRRVKSTLTR